MKKINEVPPETLIELHARVYARTSFPAIFAVLPLYLERSFDPQIKREVTDNPHGRINYRVRFLMHAAYRKDYPRNYWSGPNHGAVSRAVRFMRSNGRVRPALAHSIYKDIFSEYRRRDGEDNPDNN